MYEKYGSQSVGSFFASAWSQYLEQMTPKDLLEFCMASCAAVRDTLECSEAGSNDPKAQAYSKAFCLLSDAVEKFEKSAKATINWKDQDRKVHLTDEEKALVIEERGAWNTYENAYRAFQKKGGFAGDFIFPRPVTKSVSMIAERTGLYPFEVRWLIERDMGKE